MTPLTFGAGPRVGSRGNCARRAFAARPKRSRCSSGRPCAGRRGPRRPGLSAAGPLDPGRLRRARAGSAGRAGSSERFARASRRILPSAPARPSRSATGAPVLGGADAVLMVEYAERSGESSLRSGRQLRPGEFINPGGAEARAGQVLLPRGRRFDFAHVNLLAMVGRAGGRSSLPPRGSPSSPPETNRRGAPGRLAHQIRIERSARWRFRCAPEGSRNPAGRLAIRMTLCATRSSADGTRAYCRLFPAAFRGQVRPGRAGPGRAGVNFTDRVLISARPAADAGRARGTFFFGLQATRPRPW